MTYVIAIARHAIYQSGAAPRSRISLEYFGLAFAPRDHFGWSRRLASGRHVVVVQHVPCEPPGTIAEALAARRLPVRRICVFHDEPVPRHVNDVAGLVVMGGPMAAYDHDKPRFRFLHDEMRLMEAAISAGVPVLGICLGGQLLASVLGAEVKPGTRKEIGWHPVWLTEDADRDPLWRGIGRRFTGFHWHGDIFDLPENAVSLASSEQTVCQAFRQGQHAYGLLFHVEMTAQIIRDVVRESSTELRQAGVSGEQIIADAAVYLAALRKLGWTIADRWAAQLQTGEI